MKLIDEVAIATMEMNTRRIHKMFCHTNMVDAKKAARKIGINVDDVADTIDCQECKLSKAKQKKIETVDEGKSKKAGERLCIDTSSVNVSTGKKKFWVLVEDQATCMKWSFFVKKKDSQVNPIVDLIKEINGKKNWKVSYI